MDISIDDVEIKHIAIVAFVAVLLLLLVGSFGGPMPAESTGEEKSYTEVLEAEQVVGVSSENSNNKIDSIEITVDKYGKYTDDINLDEWDIKMKNTESYYELSKEEYSITRFGDINHNKLTNQNKPAVIVIELDTIDGLHSLGTSEEVNIELYKADGNREGVYTETPVTIESGNSYRLEQDGMSSYTTY
jgi:hypothetical protein